MFLATDPEGGDLDKPLTQNGYNYVSNNPLMFVDRDGREQSYQPPGGGGAIPFSLFLRSNAMTKGTGNINSLRRAAVRDAWKLEMDLVKRTGRGTRNWTKAEKDELLRTGKVKGYEGHHINNVANNPSLAGDPRNVKFVKGRAEHLKEHGGNWRNPTSGSLINR